MKKLTVIILICDKDYFLADSLIDDVNKKIKNLHEIILVDNREEHKDKEINFRNAKIITEGYNLHQLESRRRAVEIATGDYIFFVDGDDEIKEIPELDYTEDIICFNYETTEDKFKCVYDIEEIIPEEKILSAETFAKIQPQLWNKFFKTEMIKTVFSKVYTGAEVSHLEDFATTAITLKYAKSIRHINDIYYIYHTERSNAMRDHFNRAEDFGMFIYGFNTAQALMIDNLTEDERLKLGIYNFYEKSSKELIEKFLNCDKEIRKECFELLTQIVYYEDVLNEIARMYPLRLSLDEMIETLKEVQTFIPEKVEPKEKIYLRRVSLILHTECNFNCPYCSSYQDERLSDDKLFENFDTALTTLENLTHGYLRPQILGGEPALWSEELQKKIVERLKDYDEYTVFTNGTNLTCPVCTATNSINVIHETNWHGKKLPKCEREKDIYTIVVTHEEIEELKEFAKLNAGQCINVQPCSGVEEKYVCTEKDIQEIKNILNSNQMPVMFSDVCDEKKTVWQIDCNTMKISSCCKSNNFCDLDKFTGAKNCGQINCGLFV